jgi:hypothetical protein
LVSSASEGGSIVIRGLYRRFNPGKRLVGFQFGSSPMIRLGEKAMDRDHFSETIGIYPLFLRITLCSLFKLGWFNQPSSFLGWHFIISAKNVRLQMMAAELFLGWSCFFVSKIRRYSQQRHKVIIFPRGFC